MINPLDLQTLLVNTFAGSWFLFVGIALIAIAGLSARFRMPAVILGMMVVLFGVMMQAWLQWLYLLVLLMLGLLVGYTIARLVKS